MRLGVSAAVIEGLLVPGDIAVASGAIEAVGLPGGGHGIAVPGFIDLQVNGFGGVNFLTTDAEGYREAGRVLLRTGVVAYQPTLISASVSELAHAIKVAGSARRVGGLAARILGVHVEGPFLSPLHRGVHPLTALRMPDRDTMLRLLDAGPVSCVTIAPELPGSLELIDVLVERGVLVSCGHTDATAEQANAAYDRGARTITHIFNGMRQFRHRDPGIVGVALARDEIIVQMICDDVHLARETETLVRKASVGRLCLVTDAIAAAGRPDGRYLIGDQTIDVRDGRAYGSDGQIGGGTTPLSHSVRILNDLGATFEEAVGSVTRVPAQLLGREDLGVLRLGGRADIAIVTDGFEVERVLLDGMDVF